MFKSGLIVAAGTLALLVASFDTAVAQRHSGGVRSFSGGGLARGFSSRGFSSRSFSARSFAGPRLHAGTAFRAPRFAAGSYYGHRHHHRHHHRFRRGVIVGLPLGFYGAYSAYGYSCDWLYRKAVITGSPYWWSRYEACLYGDY